jgi:2-polyprenyl-3-methyl-5-hydroxy-6-metoxy-1,4-benzoquinol methylase
VQPERLPSQAELSEYYRTYSYDDPDSWRVDPATEASLSNLAGALAPYRSSGRLLDVGCGAGSVLRAMSRHGWRSEGQEISTVAAKQLKKEGFRIHSETLEGLEASEPFDVIVMSEVIEHLPAPHLTLSAAHDLLRPGGALYLTTPNFGSLSRRVLRDRWRAIELPEHLSYFDRRTLEAFLMRAGFAKARVWSEGLNPYELAGTSRAQNGGDRDRLRSQTENLRLAATRRGSIRSLKRLTNLALRLGGLGDTLKALAEK